MLATSAIANDAKAGLTGRVEHQLPELRLSIGRWRAPRWQGWINGRGCRARPGHMPGSLAALTDALADRHQAGEGEKGGGKTSAARVG